uniref:fos-related antigen 2-like n=1 Tax=Myxine glutinosa TaxID=7769 RepID=UPI00358E5993
MDLVSAMFHDFTSDLAPFQTSCPEGGFLEPRTPLGAMTSCRSFGSDGCISQGLESAPTITDIASNDELQWIVEACSVASAEPPAEPGRVMTVSPPGVLHGIRTPRPAGGRRRRNDDLKLSPDEAEKRCMRRERNKQAAARCRNRRQQLMEHLQGSNVRVNGLFCSLFSLATPGETLLCAGSLQKAVRMMSASPGTRRQLPGGRAVGRSGCRTSGGVGPNKSREGTLPVHPRHTSSRLRSLSRVADARIGGAAVGILCLGRRTP